MFIENFENKNVCKEHYEAYKNCKKDELKRTIESRRNKSMF